MNTLIIVLYILSLVCALVAAAIGHAPADRPWARTNWLALAFAIFVFIFLLSRLVPA